MKTLATIGLVAVAAVAVLYYLHERKRDAADAASDVARERAELVADHAKREGATKSPLEGAKRDAEAAERNRGR